MDISATELLIALTVALLIFGPGQVSKVARGLGEAMHEFRAASADRAQPSAVSAPSRVAGAAVDGDGDGDSNNEHQPDLDEVASTE